MEEKISGTVSHIVFRNEDNGYTVLEIVSEGKEITCVGNFSTVSEGQTLLLTGRYTEHVSYGRQLKVDTYEIRAPETAEAIETYLGSGSIRGIGKALASRIVKMFGKETMRILEEEPERLAEVKGISISKAREIGKTVAQQAGIRQAVMFLSKFDISMQMGIRIYKEYGEDMYRILKENPYKLAEDIDGIGFVKADRIAESVGFGRESEYRLRSGILYVLMMAAGDGSVYLPETELRRRASDILGVDEELIGDALVGLAFEHKVILKRTTARSHPADGAGELDEPADDEERIVYAGRYYYLELNCARMLTDLCIPSGETREEAEKKLAKQEESSRIVLEQEQREAVLTAAMSGLLVLTGGPGTGKTTTINEIIRYFRRERLTVALAAPTGRAAKRMTETTGYEAKTIHRLLEISSSAEEDAFDIRFTRNASNPLETDVVIIDEMSMVDISLMYALLLAVRAGTRLILVGDVDQLPSVGPGAVLRDVIRSKAFPCVELTKIFRQAESSDIVVNAHKINHGEQISLSNKSRDFFFLRRDDTNRIISNIIELIRDKLPPYVHAGASDIQVLAPMRKGPLGVERLNAILQEYLNPPGPDKKEKSYGDRLFRVGDKIMQTKNNYQIGWEVRGRYGFPIDTGEGIFNGDMGIIREIDDYTRQMLIEFDDGRFVDYPYAELEDLELAYAVTIHKSQGSEYPAVILPLLSGPRMLMTRNLLYTAVTRAKSCVVILGSEDAVRSMIQNKSEQLRYTSLDERIRELCTEDHPSH